ncbi:HlyD family type I secretion periplasmic adaptor subunit [Kordiimonas pumila]|uniref:Membrane fusion protein (MFP) family protein n=2 Tax=Kordiimonas pumila TaxID=2161677 RepID=A0ABV7D4W1_9PROT|nr:HlyD family type I secretion periplasmic adaptor subunit [Kordiimonas pumila]
MSDIVPVSSNLPAVKSDKFERASLQKWAENIDVDRKPLLRKALYVFIIVFVFGGIWSVTAELGGAVIASGKVVAEGKNRLIQNLEGGILKELNVKEGDKVKEGDILALLDPLQLAAQLESNQLQRAIARIQLARLRAEVHNLADIQFPTDIDPAVADHPRVIEAISSQTDEFVAGRNFRRATDEILDTRIKGLEGDIEGQKEVLEAYNRQLELFELELKDFKVLLEQGHIARTRVFATERKVVELIATVANVKLDMQKARNEILNYQTEKRQNMLEFKEKANNQLIEAQKTLSSADSSVARLTDMLDRSIIRSPVEGTVFRMGKHTLGEVVKPGETMFVVFPDDDALTIEAYLQPTDREHIHTGQDVEVIFPSDKQSRMTPVPGKLIYVSADTITSEQDPTGKYLVKILVDPDHIPKQLLPGNIAEAYIQTEPTTFAAIMAKPFTRFAFRAFKG